MTRKQIIGILCICTLGCMGVGSWYWCSATKDSMTTSTNVVSTDNGPVTVKKVPVPEMKIVPTEGDTTENTGDPLLVDMKGAVNLYKQQYPTAQIRGITFDEQNGRKSYEVAGVSSEAGHSVMIDAMTGQVISSAVEQKTETSAESANIDLGDIITPDEARRVAMAMLGDGAQLLRWSLETQGYVARYHLALDMHGETMLVTIDANSSQVIEVIKEE